MAGLDRVPRLVPQLLVAWAAVSTTLHAGQTVATCELQRFIDESALVALVEARDVASLRSAWGRLPYHDLVERVVYYTRLTTLAPNEADEIRLLETIPTSPLEFRYVYAINDTRAWDAHTAVRDVYDAYFEVIGKLAAKHAEYIERLLRLNRFADGESKNSTDAATRSLRQLNPTGYLAALRKLDTEAQVAVCGDCPELQGSGVPKRP